MHVQGEFRSLFFVFISSFALRQFSQPSTWPLTQFTFSMEANNWCVSAKCTSWLRFFTLLLTRQSIRSEKRTSNTFQTNFNFLESIETHLNQDRNNFKGKLLYKSLDQSNSCHFIVMVSMPPFLSNAKKHPRFLRCFVYTHTNINNEFHFAAYVKLSRAGRVHSSNSVLEPRSNIHLKWLNWNHNFRLLSKWFLVAVVKIFVS